MAQVCFSPTPHCDCRSYFNHHILDLGKVLAGIQVPPNDYEEFNGFLKNLNYIYIEETENLVYKRYLRKQ